MTLVTSRRSLVTVVVASLVFAAMLVTATTGGATAAFAFSRYAGTDRYDTAKRIAADGFGSSDVVVIASGTRYADALAGTYAAGLAGLPILLTDRDTLPAPTSSELTALGATKALIIGGTAAVGAGAEAALKAKGLSTTRIAGTTRYETSKLVAESGGASAVGKTGAASSPTAVVASGEQFPDALSAGPMGYAAHLPIVLTTADALSPEAKSTLTDLGIRSVLIVGGTSAVSTATETAIVTMGIAVTRLAGTDRTETATKVADHELANLGFANTHVDLSRGDDFADALAGAAHSGKVKAPSLLTTSATTLGTPTRTWLTAHYATLATGHINGGTSAVSAAVESDATTAGRTAPSTSSTVPGSSTLPTLPVPTSVPSVPTLTPCTAPQQGPGQPFCFAPPSSPLPGTTSTTTSTTSTTAAPAGPKFSSAVAANLSPIITVTYDQPLNCATVDVNGTGYVITVTAGAGTGTSVSPALAACNGAAVTLTLASGNFQTGQIGAVTAKVGADGDTVKNLTGQSQAVGDHVTYTV